MNSSPQAKTYTGHDFLHTKTVVVPPASKTQYSLWYDFAAVNNQGDLNNVFAISGKYAAMNAVILEIGNTAAVQNYDLCLATSDAARFPENTLYSALQIQVPHISEGKFDEAVAHLQKNASHAMSLDGPSSSGGFPIGGGVA